MRNMKNIKGRIDFYKYLLFLDKSRGITIVMNIGIFIISLRLVIIDILNFDTIKYTDIESVLLFIFSLFNIVWGIINQYKDIKSFSGNDKEIEMKNKMCITKEDFIFHFDKVTCSKQESIWGFKNILIGSNGNNDNVIFSEELNKYLWNNRLELEVYKQKEKLVKEFILKNKEIVMPFFQYKYYNSMRKNQSFFNENKLCMSSDIVKGKAKIQCHRGSYYDSFLTNEICTRILERKEDSIIIYDASNFYPCSKGNNEVCELQPITKSRLNNHIGVSTLAYTKDRYFIIRMQSARAQQNMEQYVPTGSGSCNWNDIKENSFMDTIEYAMQRELWEENGGQSVCSLPNELGQTKILGFYRWLKRGGKPEFVGITKVNYNLNDLKANKDELKDIHNTTIDDTIYVGKIDDIPKFISDIYSYGNLSVPLEMCLKSLELYYNERKEELKEFLNL